MTSRVVVQVPGKSKASKQHYNVCSDRCISFDGIAKIVASALGQEPNIVHYDPSKVRVTWQCRRMTDLIPMRTLHRVAVLCMCLLSSPPPTDAARPHVLHQLCWRLGLDQQSIAAMAATRVSSTDASWGCRWV